MKMITVSPYYAPGLGWTSMQIAKKTIRDIRNYGKVDKLTKDMAMANRIIDIVCERFDISHELLVSANRSATPKTARHIAIEIIRRKTKLTLKEVGNLFNRDHTTVIHSVQTIQDWRRFDLAFDNLYLGVWDKV